jgi:hypothetical protein
MTCRHCLPMTCNNTRDLSSLQLPIDMLGAGDQEITLELARCRLVTLVSSVTSRTFLPNPWHATPRTPGRNGRHVCTRCFRNWASKISPPFIIWAHKEAYHGAARARYLSWAGERNRRASERATMSADSHRCEVSHSSSTSKSRRQPSCATAERVIQLREDRARGGHGLVSGEAPVVRLPLLGTEEGTYLWH